MRFLDVIETRGGGRRRIELWHGDLTELSRAGGVDALVVSAFPDDYVPTRTSLIGALDRHGVSVEALSHDKDIDLRSTMSCWLSQGLSPVNPDLGFHRVLVFEPLQRGEPPELVGDIFRSLMPITIVRPEITSIALPIVAAGNMGYPIAAMLEPLIEAATHWLDAGLPLQRVLIVAYREEHAAEALSVFTEAKTAYLTPSRPAATPTDYDVFISYSRKNAAECDALIQALREAYPGIRLFVDRHELDPGAAWQMKIYESLDRCDKVVALLSPEYLSSKMCLEEFNIALARGRQADRAIVFPVYLFSTDLPTYMTMSNYVDCREGDRSRMSDVSKAVISLLDRGR